MPQPPAYTRTKDFTENFGSETDHTSLNAEYDKASTSINAIRTNLALMQADDGKIKQAAITTDSLSATVKDFLINEVSTGVVTYRDQAATSATNSAASETNAANSATASTTSATNSSTSATLSQNWATKTDAEVVVGQGFGAKKYANDAAASAASVQTYIDHVSSTANPHSVTKAQVGLGSVDNTSDADKPVSTAQQAALDAKVGKSGDETIADVKTFSSSPIVPTVTAGDTSAKAANMAALAASFVQGTAQATTSGASKDFTAIPAWAKRIIISFSGLSTTGTSLPMIQLGDSGGIEASGYMGASINLPSTTSVNYTNGFRLAGAWLADSVIHGHAVLTLLDAATNTWSFSANLAYSSGASTSSGGGSKSLATTLDRIRLTTVGGTETFDAGIFNIQYE